MSEKFFSVIKNLLLAIPLFAATAYIFMFHIASELDDPLFGALFGTVLCTIYFFCLPVAAFSTPFIIKFIKKLSTGRFLIVSLCSLSVYILIILATSFACKTYLSRFTTEKWIKHPDARYLMLDDLNEKHKLRGMTEEKLINLLGKEDERSLPDGDSFSKLYLIHPGFLSYKEMCFYLENGVVTDIKIVLHGFKNEAQEIPFP